MRLTDEQIRIILQQTSISLETDIQLEDSVMEKIEVISTPQKSIQPLRRKTRISAWASIGLIVCFILSVVYWFITLRPTIAEDINTIQLSTMMIVVLVLLQLFVGYLTKPVSNLTFWTGQTS